MLKNMGIGGESHIKDFFFGEIFARSAGQQAFQHSIPKLYTQGNSLEETQQGTKPSKFRRYVKELDSVSSSHTFPWHVLREFGRKLRSSSASEVEKYKSLNFCCRSGYEGGIIEDDHRGCVVSTARNVSFYP
jgi:hypothetical protein